MSVKAGRDFIYLIWKSEKNGKQYIVGQLSKNGEYEFKYDQEVKEAQREGFELLVSFPDVDKTYYSKELFPTFMARLPDKKRKDIDKILAKYKLDNYDPYLLLKRSGARLPIDKIFFIDPIFDLQTSIERYFYIAGSRHYLGCGKGHCDATVTVAHGEAVYLQREEDNVNDANAVKVMSMHQELLGYIPRYYSEAVAEAIDEKREIRCFIAAVNMNGNCDECIKLALTII